MVFHYQQFDINQSHAAMKVGTDSDLLGTLGAGGNHILDIGTGTGVLSLMYAQRYPDAHITAVEIDENAIIDARQNFDASPFRERITLRHISFQNYLKEAEKSQFDSVVCNPPYFDKSLECPDNSRTRARHTSSLPFPTLVRGAYDLLQSEGLFSVCIPPEVLTDFCAECLHAGFTLQDIFRIQTTPKRPVKRIVLVHRKGFSTTREHTFCMLNPDGSRSPWYLKLMSEFHLPAPIERQP